MNASEMTGGQAIAAYLATGRTPIFQPHPLPVISRDGCRDIAIGYWGDDVTCSCCGDTKPRRWLDHVRGELGTCLVCGRPLLPVPVPLGPRCAHHKHWKPGQKLVKSGRGRP